MDSALELPEENTRNKQGAKPRQRVQVRQIQTKNSNLSKRMESRVAVGMD